MPEWVRITFSYKELLRQTKPISAVSSAKTDRKEGEPRKRGRGTTKDTVAGAVARGGKAVAQLVNNVTSKTLLDFIKKFVKTADADLYTDSYRGYNEAGATVKQHETLNRSEKWETDGDTYQYD